MTNFLSASLVQRRIDLRDTQSAVRDMRSSTPDIVQRAMARYLVVRSAGYIEAVRDDVADYFSATKASDEVVRRIRLHLRNGQGVMPNQLLEFVKSFHPDWHTELETLFAQDDNLLKSQLGALVSARKKIAHGEGETVTASKALAWSEAAEILVNWLVQRFDPNYPVRSPVIRDASS
ncbi:HEPN domain-containing protein [Pseudarthrobacter sp. fls2-241-R2A-127]|uniref:HEPN domain-containing protein n=1 Tax=Pseudarthrobacter sp. fls2-241-R2A-127 TaxID=3040303 RepID=UPI003305FAB3